jgi:hypothetical protein
MTHTANHAVPEQGKFRRALAAVWAFLQAMEPTSFDYTLDRIERLEGEVRRLKEELHQIRDLGPSMLTTAALVTLRLNDPRLQMRRNMMVPSAVDGTVSAVCLMRNS